MNLTESLCSEPKKKKQQRDKWSFWKRYPFCRGIKGTLIYSNLKCPFPIWDYKNQLTIHPIRNAGNTSKFPGTNNLWSTAKSMKALFCVLLSSWQCYPRLMVKPCPNLRVKDRWRVYSDRAKCLFVTRSYTYAAILSGIWAEKPFFSFLTGIWAKKCPSSAFKLDYEQKMPFSGLSLLRMLFFSFFNRNMSQKMPSFSFLMGIWAKKCHFQPSNRTMSKKCHSPACLMPKELFSAFLTEIWEKMAFGHPP